MSGVVSINPLEESARFVNLSEQLRKGFKLNPMDRLAKKESKILVDVAEDERSYSVMADIPGAKKDDIKVSIDGNQVSISVELRPGASAGMRFSRRERHVGTFSRSFTVAQEINDREAQAKYVDGVLELLLPKAGARCARPIAIA